MTDSKLFDIEPGGENTQYESIQTVTAAPQKQSGQMGVGAQQTASAETNLSGHVAPEPNSDESAASDMNGSDDASDKLVQEQWFGGKTNSVFGEADIGKVY